MRERGRSKGAPDLLYENENACGCFMAKITLSLTRQILLRLTSPSIILSIRARLRPRILRNCFAEGWLQGTERSWLDTAAIVWLKLGIAPSSAACGRASWTIGSRSQGGPLGFRAWGRQSLSIIRSSVEMPCHCSPQVLTLDEVAALMYRLTLPLCICFFSRHLSD